MGVFEDLKKGSSTSSSGGGVFATIKKEKKDKDDAASVKNFTSSQAKPKYDALHPSPDSIIGNALKPGPTYEEYKSTHNQFVNPYITQSPTMQSIAKLDDTPTNKERFSNDPSRKIPVIGKVLQALDSFSSNKAAIKVGEVGRALYTPGAGLANVAGLTGATEAGISKLLPKLASTTGGRIAQTAAKEAIVGAPLGAGQALAQGHDGKEALKQGAYGALLGGGLGAAGAGLAAGAKGAINSSVSKLMGNIFQQVKNDTKINPVKLKISNPEEAFQSIAPKVFKDATERMTPPLENETALAKWVQTHLNEAGHNVSVNEVKKLGYETLRKYSDDIVKEFNLPSVAKQAADDLGYGKIYNKETPTIKQVQAADESSRAYGFTAPKVDVSREFEHIKGAEIPKSEPLPETHPVKQSWFTRLFGEQNVGFTPFGSKKSDRMVSTEQQIVNNPLKNNVSGAVETTKQAARAAYQNTVDNLSPLKTINRDTYNTAMDASRANNLANTIVRDKFVDNEGNVIGGSLNDVMKTVRGLGKKFDDYLVLRNSVDRMKDGQEVYHPSLNMTSEKAAERVRVLEERYPQLKTAGDQWNEFHGNLLDSGVKEDLLTPEARASMRETRPNYAANRRQFTIGEKLAQPKFGSGGSSFSGQKAPIKSVSPTGSIRKIVTPVRSAIEQAYAWKNAELRNRTMKEIVKTIQLDPEAMKGIVEIVKKPTTSYRSLDDALREGGSEEFLDQLDNDFKSLFKHAKAGEENVVRAMIKGQPVYVKVHNPEAVKALLGLGSDQSGIVLAALQKLSNATKRGATGLLAPMFAVKNLTSDVAQAAIQSPNAFKHIAVDLPHALISSIGDILKIPGMKNLAEDFRRSGGEYSALLRDDRSLNKSVYNLRKEAPFSARGIAKGTTALVKAPFKALEKLADTTENLNRMAAFRRSLTGKERTPENVRKAINAARESTTNYSRKGAHAKETEAFIPYSNAAVQGIYRISKAMYKNPVKTMAGISTLVLAPKLYEYSKFKDDPDYKKLPARELYRNIITSKNKDGTFNKIPMPPEYSAFGAYLVDVLSDVNEKDPQAYKGTWDALANAYTPPIVSGALQGLTQGGSDGKSAIEKSLVGAVNATVAAPFVATIANQSFTGAPIVPQRLQDNSAEFQSDERTSKIAQSIGRKIDLAPLKVDYLLRAYGGDPARLILPLTSDAGGGMPKATLLKNFIVDPVFTNTLSNDFYDAKDKYTKANNDYTQFDKPLPDWFDEGTHKLLTSQAKGSVSKELAAYAQDKRDIQGDASLSKKDKAERLRDIQSKINQIYVDVNSGLLKSGYKFPNR